MGSIARTGFRNDTHRPRREFVAKVTPRSVSDRWAGPAGAVPGKPGADLCARDVGQGGAQAPGSEPYEQLFVGDEDPGGGWTDSEHERGHIAAP